METIEGGFTIIHRPNIQVSKKEQKFLDLLSSKNIYKFIKFIKKSKKDYFNTPVPGLNILILHYALEKISKEGKEDFFKDLLKISLYKTKESSVYKYFYEEYSGSLFNIALDIGNKFKDYSIFINLIQRFKDIFEYQDFNKYFSSSKISKIGLLNKSDLLFFFESPFFYKKIIGPDFFLYSYFFSKYEEFSFEEIKKISKINTSDLFKNTDFYNSWKKLFNEHLEQWLKYNFENSYLSKNTKEKALFFVRAKYLQNKDSHELDLNLSFINKIVSPLVEKNFIVNSINLQKSNPINNIKRL